MVNWGPVINNETGKLLLERHNLFNHCRINNPNIDWPCSRSPSNQFPKRI